MAHTAKIKRAIASNAAIIKKTRGTISSMDANEWLAVVGIISAIALGFGLVTTLISAGLGWKINREQKVEIAQLNKDTTDAGERAANALKDAGIANEAASKADESAAKANERAQRLERDNIQLRTDLETATREARTKQTELAREQGKLAAEQRKTAEAQEQAAVAQLALRKHLEEVAARQADRTLAKGFRNVYEIDRANLWKAIIRYKSGDDEAFRFAREITNRMRSAGWNIDEEPRPISKDPTIDPTMASWAPGVRPGITILPPTQSYGTYKEKWATILAEDFTAAGFTPFVVYSVDAYLTIIVGGKGESRF